MNKLFPIISVVGLVLLCGCKEKKQPEDIIAPKVEVSKPQGPIRMQNYDDQKEVAWLGKQYTVEIKRTASDSLQMVKDESGQQFVDNEISLRIVRADGSVFFKKLFTKATFNAQLDDDYRHTGILEGLVFDKVDGNQLNFAASVCHPQTDEYIPLVLTVDNYGNIAIKRDTEMDTRGNGTDDLSEEE